MNSLIIVLVTLFIGLTIIVLIKALYKIYALILLGRILWNPKSTWDDVYEFAEKYPTIVKITYEDDE